jgi:hypothetical protein
MPLPPDGRTGGPIRNPRFPPSRGLGFNPTRVCVWINAALVTRATLELGSLLCRQRRTSKVRFISLGFRLCRDARHPHQPATSARAPGPSWNRLT